MANNESSVLYSDCYPNWPQEICAFGNVCGYANAVLFFLVFLPQIYRNFKHRNVIGLSSYWIVANFTAGLNNAFFAFKWGDLPIFVKINGVYFPIIQAVLLIQILIFTPFSRRKLIVSILCLALWIGITLLQVFLSVYDWMQWITVILWGVGPYPQVILNMSRQSTKGLSTVMMCIRTSNIISWFFSTYLLNLPIQNAILCYFAGTGGFILSMQVTYYWKNPPLQTGGSPIVSLQDKEKSEKIDVEFTESPYMETSEYEPSLSTSCNIIRICFLLCLSLFLACYVVALVWRLQTPIAIIAPIGIALILLSCHFYLTTSYGRFMQQKMKRFVTSNALSEMILVKK